MDLKYGFMSIAICLLSACGGGTDTKDDQSSITDPDPIGAITDTPKEPVNPINDLEESSTDCSELYSILTPLDDNRFEVKNLVAAYYSEIDDFNTGQGTNGTDPSIERTLVHTEDVERFRLHYIREEFHDIASDKLNINWTGEIEVLSDQANIQFEYALSWSDITVKVNDEVLGRTSNCEGIVTLTLAQGTHDIEIDYHNHWHTTDVDVAIKKYGKYSLEEASALLEGGISSSDKIVFADVSGSNSLLGEVEIILPDGGDQYVLILKSDDPVSWKVQNGKESQVKAVVYSSDKYASEYQGAMVGIPIVDIGRALYLSEERSIAGISNDLVGRVPDYVVDLSTVSSVDLLGKDTLSLELLYGTPELVLANLSEPNEVSFVADSEVSGQEIASYMSFPGGVISEFEWTIWSDSVGNSPVEETFQIQIYSDRDGPYYSDTIYQYQIKPVPYYRTENGGSIYKVKVQLEADKLIELDEGDYWISVQYYPQGIDVDYRIVLENDGENNGGAFRNGLTGDWSSTDSLYHMKYARGLELNLKAYIAN